MNVTVDNSKPDREWFEEMFGQNTLNHECGHFIYIVENTTEYYKYRQDQKVNDIPHKGGHQPDDEGGKKAEEYGGLKDIEKEDNNE